MAARPLNEAVQQAEEAISGGNYQLAVETCRRVLGQFPEFATAHRLLGEAHLEAGDAEAAAQAFHETLQRDPQSSAAYAGLATISEGRGDVERALAYAQVAWEINPQRADLRDRVASLSERLYGKGGRLHLTRPALTSLHFRAGRWSRAAAEAAAVLGDHPTRVDVQLRLAESLWRRGNLTAAGNACRAVLESTPAAVMALLMLADCERRGGNQESATQLLERARAIDPDGVCAADLVTIGSTDLAEFMLPAQMPEFDDTADVTAEAERPRIAPAPDFSWTQPEVESPPADTDITDKLVAEAPASVEASAAPATSEEGNFDVSLPDDAEIEAARPPARTQRGYTSMLQSLEGEGLMPFRLDGDEGSTADDAATATPEPGEQEDVFSLVSDEEIEAARPPDQRPHGYTTLLNSLDQSGVAPFEIDGAPGYPTEASAPTDVDTAPAGATEPPIDYGTDLTAGWDDIDDEIQRATPSDESALTGYTGQLRDLDEIGVQPFSIEGVDAGEPYQGQLEDEIELDDAYGADLSFLDMTSEPAPANAAAAEPVSYGADLTDGWATIDEEIQNAIPAETPPGYTDELNELGQSGVEPFFVETEEPEQAAEPEYSVPSTLAAEDVVSDELAAGLELWSYDSEPADETEAETESDAIMPVAAETVSTTDLFDFADDEGVADEMAAVATQPESGFAEEFVEPVAAEATITETQSDDAIRSGLVRLGVDAALFERARQAKLRLVAAGQLQGDQLLPGVEPPGPTLEELEQAVQANPDDLDARRSFVGALVGAEEFERAFGEFQWMFRQRLPFEEQDLANLAQAASRGDQPERGHRLLGAVYRRSGNLGMSARHYRISLAGDRGPEKEA